MSDPATPQTDTPVPETIPITDLPLPDYRKARDEGKTEVPNPAKPPEPDPEPDPDLQAAVDEIEPPAAEETPQQRSARTKKHREAAIKARVTKLAKARDAERQRAERLERELQQLRTRPPAPNPPDRVDRPTAEAYDGADPKDPEPEPKDYDSDYAWTRAHARWAARVERRIADHAARESYRTRVAAERADADRQAFVSGQQTLKERIEAYKTTHPDFDAKTTNVEYSLLTHRVLMRSDEGPAIAEYLADTPDLNAQIRDWSQTDPERALIALGRVEAEILARRKAPPKPSTAPAPPARTLDGSGHSDSPDPDFAEMDLAQYRAYKAKRARTS